MSIYYSIAENDGMIDDHEQRLLGQFQGLLENGTVKRLKGYVKRKGAKMGDKGKKDKGKREVQKKSKQTQKEKRKQKKDKNKSIWADGR